MLVNDTVLLTDPDRDTVQVCAPVRVWVALLVGSKDMEELLVVLRAAVPDALPDCMQDAVGVHVPDRLAVQVPVCRGEADRVCDEDTDRVIESIRLIDGENVFETDLEFVSDRVGVVLSNKLLDAVYDREPLMVPLEAVADLLHEPWMGTVNVTVGDPLQVVVEV